MRGVVGWQKLAVTRIAIGWALLDEQGGRPCINVQGADGGCCSFHRLRCPHGAVRECGDGALGRVHLAQ